MSRNHTLGCTFVLSSWLQISAYPHSTVSYCPQDTYEICQKDSFLFNCSCNLERPVVGMKLLMLIRSSTSTSIGARKSCAEGRRSKCSARGPGRRPIEACYTPTGMSSIGSLPRRLRSAGSSRRCASGTISGLLGCGLASQFVLRATRGASVPDYELDSRMRIHCRPHPARTALTESWTITVRRRISFAVDVNGGMSTTTSPKGRRIAPRRRASRITRCPVLFS
jgi:hypothetical protein